ncbi:MarR family transcriptional regulator [Tropicimonas sp. TH_r6]|uniref:MarR family transcriptional regulator n=1 Tax=Tropicimonas sp. TH_r6 TaxID=3082085 RepID=UPI002954A2C2|nr:MarR family transcriptional regulator [Tropicimonas sp. TH_r6]MDV7143357.1 MarR family transcriptional regulator [Tropicimonas sp. TH_r6]
MAAPVTRLDRSVAEFMRHVPVHLAPILLRAEYRGRLLPESEVMVVMMLAEDGPLSPTAISRGLNMQKGSLTSVLKRLEGLDLIRRRDNPEDDRSYIAQLTREGEDFARQVEAQRRNGLHALFGPMGARNSRAAITGLDTISAHFRKLEEKTMTNHDDQTHASLNWYHAATPEDRREYDGFGPWLSEVKSEADMPPRFLAFYGEHKDAKFLFKVPRNADRRQLRPGMDLYDAVLAVHDHGIFIAKLDAGGVSTRQSNWDHIAAIGNFGDRLQGIWSAYLKDGSRANVTFNKVSSEMMDEVTDFARGHLVGPAREVATTTDPIEITDSDLFFGSALLEIRRRGRGPFTPIHFEPQGKPCMGADGKKAETTGVLLLDSPEELVIVNRDKPSHRRGEAWHASNDIFVPYEHLTHVSLIPAANGTTGEFHTLVLRLDGQAIEQPCLTVPEAAIKILQERIGHAE